MTTVVSMLDGRRTKVDGDEFDDLRTRFRGRVLTAVDDGVDSRPVDRVGWVTDRGGLVMKTRLLMAVLLVPAMTVTAAGLVDAAPKESAPKSLNWSQCYRDLSAETNQFLGELGEPLVRYECATVRVPLDHSEPNGAKINLSLVRIPAADPAAKIGSLFLNPGGPGGSGVDFALFFGPFIGLELGADVRARFDVVGFDPRGIWRSTPIKCFGNENQGVQTFPPVAYPLTDEEVQATVAGVELLADRCDRGATATQRRHVDRQRRPRS